MIFENIRQTSSKFISRILLCFSLCFFLAVFLKLSFTCTDAFANDAPTAIANIGVNEHIGTRITIEGVPSNGKPVLILLDQAASPEFPYAPGKDFEVVSLHTEKLKPSDLTQLGFANAHPPSTILLTPDGTIYRYLYGTNFHEKDLKFALIGASEQKIGSGFDHFLFSIFHFDSLRNSYTVDLWKIVSGVLFIQAILAILFFLFFWKKKKT